MSISKCALINPSPRKSPTPYLDDQLPKRRQHIFSSSLNASQVKLSTCPLSHGTASSSPYPNGGYHHGRKMCAKGCRVQNGKVLEKQESIHARVMREALEYQMLRKKELNINEEEHKKRCEEVKSEIEATGTYKQTFDEIEYGVRVGWRNTPKCANRAYWDRIDCIDARDLKTGEKIFEAVCEHIRVATNDGNIRALITVFDPVDPFEVEKTTPRIWNSQLIRYAGHTLENGSILGDPAEQEFTKMLKLRFGWDPKHKTAHDVLPVVIQSDQTKDPEMFEYPPDLVVEIDIEHPAFPWFKDFGLKWYGVPAISSAGVDIGGVVYECAPFNGWYMVTEVGTRNFCDESRYNMAPKIARKMGIDTSTEATLWRDVAVCQSNIAVLHSFRKAGVVMVDHHTVTSGFYEWFQEEMKTRGYCTGNWKWIIPPTTGSTGPCYLGLKTMLEYTLKPNYVPLPNPLKVYEWKKELVVELKPFHLGPLIAAAKFLRVVKKKRPTLSIIYSTESGTARRFALLAFQMLRHSFNASVRNVKNMEPTWFSTLSYVYFITSTFGIGELPASAAPLERWLRRKAEEGLKPLTNMKFSLLTLGNSNYEHFCGSGNTLEPLLLTCGATSHFPRVDADELSGQQDSFGMSLSPYFRMNHITPSRRERNKSIAGSLLNGRTEMKEAVVTWQFVPVVHAPKHVNVRGRTYLKPLPGRVLDEKFAVKILTSNMTLQHQDISGGGFVAKFVKSEDLYRKENDECSDTEYRVAKRVQLDISGIKTKADTKYSAGDHLRVYPVNQIELVHSVASAIGLPLSQLDVAFSIESTAEDEFFDAPETQLPVPCTYRYILSAYLDIASPPQPELLQRLSKYCSNDEERHRLAELGNDIAVYKQFVLSNCPTLATIYQNFPSLKTPVDIFFTAIAPHIPQLKSRVYSISSSPLQDNNRLDLTIGVTRYEAKTSGDTSQNQRFGVCSNFLSSPYLNGTSEIHARIGENEGFHLPKDPLASIIMVGSGSGIGSFRGFWQEFSHPDGKREGECVLFCGFRYPSECMYSEEMSQCERDGVMTVIPAYSRIIAKKVYVQHKIDEHKDYVLSLISEENSHVYVCGDEAMAQGVRRAFERITEEVEMSQIWRAFIDSGRYHEDVFVKPSLLRREV